VVITHDDQLLGRAKKLNFLNVEYLNTELQHRVMRADETGHEEYIVTEK